MRSSPSTGYRAPSIRHATTIALAAAGPVAAIALLATLDGSSGDRAALHIGAAALALGCGLAAVIDLQRKALETRARGRSMVVGTATRGGPAALMTAAATILIILVVSAAIELLALGASGGAEQDSSSGSNALQEARARRDATDGAIDGAANGDSSDFGLVGPNPDRQGGAGAGAAAVGDLLSGAEVLRIRRVGSGEQGAFTAAPLHLRGFVLDAYDPSGRLRERRGTARHIDDADDGASDGWLDLRSARRAPTGHEVILDVSFVPETNGLVFAPSQLMGVRATSADIDAAQASVTLPRHEASAYRVRSVVPMIRLDEMRSVRARGSLGATLPRAERGIELPRSTPSSPRGLALEQLRGFAASLTRGARTDIDRVLAIVQHLRTEFSYEIYNTQFLTPEEFEGFRERGAGSCTHFASLAVLLLRLEGIPARVAAGYVAREIDPYNGEWIVRQRDGHAWIEVHFERFGWLAFDPTPGDPAVGGTSSGWSPLADEGQVDVDALGRATPRTSPLGRVLVGAFGSLSRWFGGALAAGVALAAAFALTIVTLLLIRFVRVPRAGTRTRETRESPRSVARPEQESSGVAALLSAVRERGWSQGSTRTPTAFAEALEERHREARGVRRAFQLVLQRACAGKRLDEDEEAHLQAVGNRIRSGPEADSE